MTHLQNNENNADTDNSQIIDLIEKVEKPNEKVMSSVTASGRIRYKKGKQKKHRHRKKETKKTKILRVIKRILIALLILLLVAALSIFIAYKVIYNQGKNAFLNDNRDVSVSTIEQADSDDDGKTVTYKGEKYKFNENIISFVFLGIDKSVLGTDNTGKSGQADAIYIFTYDIKTKKCCIIPVSREIMADVAIYSPDGELMGYDNMQLCLAYAYGNGKNTSCDNTLASLSRIFYNIPFSNVISLNWDSVAPLNELVGGVTLTSLETISSQGLNVREGDEITLYGKNAWAYVKYRNITELKSNNNRLARQKQYINAYMSKLIPKAKKDFSTVNDLLDIADQYMYTNLSVDKLVYTASEILPEIYSAKDIEFVSIKGDIISGKQYAEFVPDEISLYETILKVFYYKL